MAKETPKDKLNSKLDKMELAGMSRTKEWASVWAQSLRYAYSDQLHGRKEHRDWEWIVVNYIWPSMMQEISKLTKNRQTIIINPWESQDAELADAWQGILQWQWERGLNNRGMRIDHVMSALDSHLFGYRVTKLFWDPKTEWLEENLGWQGDVALKVWHPAEFWANDDEYIHDGDAGTVRLVEKEELIKQFPDFRKQINEAETIAEPLAVSPFDSIRGQLASSGTFPSAGRGEPDKGVRTVGMSMLLNLILRQDTITNPQNDTKIKADKEFLRVSDTYFRDFKTTHEKIEQAVPKEELLSTGQIRQQGNVFVDREGEVLTAETWPKRLVKEFDRPSFPRGRNVFRVGDIILKDEPYKYSQWPFVVVPHYVLPHMWQGVDAIQLYKTTQDMINVSVSHLLNNVKMHGDPKVVMEKGAVWFPKGRDKAHFKVGKGAGRIITLVKGALGKRFRFEPPPPMNPAVLQMYQLSATEFKNIQGLQDIAQGKKTPGKVTATEAQHLAISSLDRIALQAVFEEEWLRQCAKLMAEITQDMYEPERMARILGPDGAPGIQKITADLKNIKFDIDIDAGFKLPFDEERRLLRFERALQLVSQPVANPMTDIMLRELQIPNWRRILEKYTVWQDWVEFLQLQEGVKTGKIDPAQAIRLLSQGILQLAGGEQQGAESASQ